MYSDQINRWARRLPTWPLYIIGGLVPVWYFWLGLTGGLGVEPIKALEQVLGLRGLQMLIATLAITPLRRFAGINLLKFRRALGLLTFYFIAAHLAVWLFLDVQIWSQIWADILKRPYVTVGMAGFVLMLPLAVTSGNWAIRAMGAGRWRQLHRLVYPTAILGGIHFLWLVKGFQWEPIVYLGIIAAILALRIRFPRLGRTAHA